MIKTIEKKRFGDQFFVFDQTRNFIQLTKIGEKYFPSFIFDSECVSAKLHVYNTALVRLISLRIEDPRMKNIDLY